MNPSEKSADHESGRRADGERSRRTILLAAAQLATTLGLDGLSIGRLAEHVGMSKSGLYAHFRSKEELELATIETALEIFKQDVLAPAMTAPPGLRRLFALADAFLSHVERRVFPGGCFFAAVASELDTRPGKARDRVCQIQRSWLDLLGTCVTDAQAAGEVDTTADAAQVLFEASAMLVTANYAFVMHGDPKLLERARQGLRNVIARVAVRTPPSGRPDSVA